MKSLVQVRDQMRDEALGNQETVADRVIERAIIRFRNELPMTSAGKSQKFLMRQAMVEELGWWRGRRRSRGSAKGRHA